MLVPAMIVVIAMPAYIKNRIVSQPVRLMDLKVKAYTYQCISPEIPLSLNRQKYKKLLVITRLFVDYWQVKYYMPGGIPWPALTRTGLKSPLWNSASCCSGALDA